MRAIRVYVESSNTDHTGSVVERLNSFDDTAATMVAPDELFIAAVGKCALRYAECVVKMEFGGEVTIKNAK